MDRLYERENVEVEMCRLCFTLALSQQAITNSPYAQEFNNFKFIELQIGFELPANICGQCLVQLNQLGSYLKMCKDAYNTYKLMKPSPQKPPPNPELTSDIKQEAVESESEEIFETSIDIADESEKLFAKFSEEDPFFETITQPQIAKVEIDCDDTSSDPFYCEDTNMEEMMNKETSSQTRTCPTCGVNVTTLASHYSKNPKCGPRNSHCPTCNLYFGNKHRLLHHQKTHHPEEVSTTSLMCHICLKAFQYADSLSQHLQTHENDQQDGCDQSGNDLTFESKMENSSHMSDRENSNCTPPAITKTAEGLVTLEALPPRSKDRYECVYQQFMEWRKKEDIVSSFSENVLLAYFGQMSEKVAPGSLWPAYSMLKSTLALHQNVHIAHYDKLRTMLIRKSKGYKPTKSKILTADEINRFIDEAPDDTYLLSKVILIIGICGACNKHELVNLNTENIEELKSAVIIKIPDKKTNQQRTFALTGKCFQIYKKYTALRPPDLKGRFFLNYQHQKCTKQYVGINKIGSTPKLIATYLGLKEAKSYTGHCYRRSSATILVDAGGEIITFERHGGWQPTSVAARSMEHSLQNQMKVVNTILHSVNNEASRTSPLPGTSSSSTSVPVPEASSSNYSFS